MNNQDPRQRLVSLRDAAVVEYERAANTTAPAQWADLTEAVCQWLPDGDYEAMQGLLAAARPPRTKVTP